MNKPIEKSTKLDDVLYDIRGPILDEATRLEQEGHRIVKLNIGNPAPFGFEAPDEVLVDMVRNLPTAQGYSDSQGIYSARKAVMQYNQRMGISGVEIDDIYIGNGVSELIGIALQGLLNNGDEVLSEIVDLARTHGLVVMADEIYDKILYDGAVHTSIASLADDVVFLTLNGLSKTYRVAGFRSGWMTISCQGCATSRRRWANLNDSCRRTGKPHDHDLSSSAGHHHEPIRAVRRGSCRP